ncbi:S-adenosyl-L-methionine-dependent methyltransferase [Xylaria arbuscula]|nr:S-adenosyl-L-methionine-dependent methyltransferase [Xylaria arbuscula]
MGTQTIVNENYKLQSYYRSLKSWGGYCWALFLLSRGLRRVEDKLAEVLALLYNSRVLDAGCGVGYVALVNYYIDKAFCNFERATSLPLGQSFYSKHFDGIYTIGMFVYAIDPEAVLEGFYRFLKPGNRVVQSEYDYNICKRLLSNMFFFLLALIPYVCICLLGLDRWFINTIAGVAAYRGKGHWRYLAISTNKPRTVVLAAQ